MRYRIKKVTYKNNEVIYFAQYYINWLIGWKGIASDGEKYKFLEDGDNLKTREDALKAIDLAESGKGILMTVEFENINR